MYIYLKYGDGHKMLLNPDCATRNLLEYVRDKCDCVKTSIVDLCDEAGQVKNLHEYTENDSPASLLEDKATYIPILIEKNDDNIPKSFQPLLQEYELTYPDLKKKLRDQCISDEKHNRLGKKRSNNDVKGKGRQSATKKKAG